MEIKRIIFSLIFVLLIIRLNAQNYTPTWDSLDKRATPDWFENAKFGIFIHWGLYSVPAWAPTGNDIGIYDKYAEWYWHRIGTRNDSDMEMNRVRNLFKTYHTKTWGENFKYQNFAYLWKAESFEPTQWADLFQKSGARYVVLTSKHHEGFALWPSNESWNWNSSDIGPQRDICGELNQAVRDKGLKMGFYYSLYEWFNPVYKSNVTKYVDEKMLPQLKDLVTRYSPDIIWVDGEWEHSSDTWKSKEFLIWLYNDTKVKSTVVVNDRWGKDTRGKHGSFFTTEYDLKHDNNSIGISSKRIWEECRGIGGSFGYNKNEKLHDYQRTEELIKLLIEKVSAGGNLLLNVGPTADGRIPVIMEQILLGVGNWLQTNGEAIFDTKSWENKHLQEENKGVFYTQKGKDLYVFITNSETSEVTVKSIKKAEKITLLGSDTKINFSKHKDVVRIAIPHVCRGQKNNNLAFVFKIEGACN